MDWLYRAFDKFGPKREPLIYRALAGFLVTIAAKYGADLSEDQVLVTIGVVTTVITALQRQKVTPVAAPNL